MAETSRSDWAGEVREPSRGVSEGGRIAALLVMDGSIIDPGQRTDLERQGVNVIATVVAEEAARGVHAAQPDVVVVDLAPGTASASEVCRRIRRVSSVPLIVTSDEGRSELVVDSLDAGADDFMPKPIDVAELSARIRALLRRSRGTSSPAVLRSGALEIHVDEGVVLLEGRPISLTRTEFRLLCELGLNAGRVLSRQQLLERVWGHRYLGKSRLIDTQVRRLRAKVEVDPSRPQRIITVRGLGYKLVAGGRA